MRRMGSSVFWAATLLSALDLSSYSQNAEPYPVRKDRPPPVGLTPVAAAYTGITLGAQYHFRANKGNGANRADSADADDLRDIEDAASIITGRRTGMRIRLRR